MNFSLQATEALLNLTHSKLRSFLALLGILVGTASVVAMVSGGRLATQATLKEIEVLVSGVGPGRDQAVRSLGGTGIKVTHIKDVTPIPHNGVRAKKPRRV